ncbi:MAG: TlpA family protein disulfide reductase [Gammaproteobacteria bacterium]|nr:TlpA family protein disulfide reductase [Gammaproteobacteria bacterium]
MFQRIRWLAAVLMMPVMVLAAGPDIRLKDIEGKEHNVNEYIGQGKWTVVAVWSADCPICRRDIYHMTFCYDENRKKNATVLGLSVDGYDNRAKAKGFIEDQSLNFPNLIGEPEDASRLSNTMFIGTPTYYFFSPEGKFMTQRIGSITQAQAEQVIRDLEKQKTPKR